MFVPSPIGASVNVLVTGSHTCGSGVPDDRRSHVSTRPSGARWTCAATRGQANTPDQRPVCAGLPGVVFENVTATGAALTRVLALSHAYAPIVWLPLASCRVSNDTTYGADVAGPTFTPSIWNWTPWMPASDTVATSDTMPDSVSADPGGVIATVAEVPDPLPATILLPGVASIASVCPMGAPAVARKATSCITHPPPTVGAVAL